jgi:hypothetical protein
MPCEQQGADQQQRQSHPFLSIINGDGTGSHALIPVQAMSCDNDRRLVYVFVSPTAFAGIAINHVPAFIAAQLIGAEMAMLASSRPFPRAASYRAKGDLAPATNPFPDEPTATARASCWTWPPEIDFWRRLVGQRPSRIPTTGCSLKSRTVLSHAPPGFPFGHGQLAAKQLLDAVDELRKLTASAI